MTLWISLFLIVAAYSFPSNVWIFTETPIQDSSLIFQLQYKRIQFLLPDWNKQIISSQDAHSYLPSTIHYTGAKLKNILKLTILDKYGGVWIDLSGILIEDLKWLDQLNQNKDVDHKSGQKPKVFAFTQSLSSKQQIFDGGLTLETSFIVAQPNSQLIKQTLKVYQSIIENGQIIKGYKTTTDNNIAKLYDEDNELILVQAFRRVLNSDNKLNTIQTYGLWTINADKGPTQYLSKVDWTQTRIVSYLSTVRGTKVNRQRKSRYFARMREHETLVINLFLDDELPIWQRLVIFLKGYRQGQLTKFFCPKEQPFLLTNTSVIGTNLLSYEPQVLNKFNSKMRVRLADYNYPCSFTQKIVKIAQSSGFLLVFTIVFLARNLIVKLLVRICLLFRKPKALKKKSVKKQLQMTQKKLNQSKQERQIFQKK